MIWSRDISNQPMDTKGRTKVTQYCMALLHTWFCKELLLQCYRERIMTTVAYLCKVVPMAKFKCAPFLIIKILNIGIIFTKDKS